MMTDNPCPTCRIVKAVCFWGPFKVANWKRPALLILSIVLMGGLLAVARFGAIPAGAVWPWALLALLFGLGVLGVVVAICGCLTCVSRLFGGI
jgi:hypothetical protein